MTVKQVAWVQSETYQAVDLMRVDAAVFGRGGTTGLARPGGVFPGFGGDLKVTCSGLTVTVASGSCVIPASTGTGCYRVVNDADVSPPALASGPTTPVRKDTIIMRVLDTGAEPESFGEVQVVAGTAGQPAPAVPAGWNAIKLAEVTVSGPTGTVTDTRTYAVAVGGVLPATSSTRPANPYDGMPVFENDTFNLAVYSSTGGVWRTVPTGSTGTWSEYPVAWRAATTNPTLGSSTIKGRYLQNGKTVHLTISLNINTAPGFGIGSGAYGFTLPVPAVTTSGPAQRQLVTAHYYDVSGVSGSLASRQWVGNGLIRSGATTISEIRLACGDPTTIYKGGVWTAGTGGNGAQPRPVANGDDLTISGTYECA